MAGGNLSPRQKMINLMYLVLTAMLALNVSAEILKAFRQINDSLGVTNTSIAAKNATLLAAFEKEASNNVKAKDNFQKAEGVRQECQNLLDIIAEVENELLLKASKKEKAEFKGESDEDLWEDISGTKMLKERGNLDIATDVLVERQDKSTLGTKLETSLKNTRSKIIALMPEGVPSSVVLIPEPKAQVAGAGVAAKTWLQSTFGDMPLTGALTQLTKLESDVRNTETEILNKLMADISAKDFKFSSLTAKVIAKSSYILTGQDYEADILLVAYDEKRTFPVKINGQTVNVEGGMGKYKVRASAPGQKKYKGAIEVKNPDGSDSLYTFEGEYTVARPAAVVSPTQMNVFYIGVDNPVAISAAGMGSDKLRASISGGGNSSLTKSGDGYIVRVTKPTGQEASCGVTVSATVDGKNMPMGTNKFRVKRIPDPIPTIGGIKLSSIPSNQFSAQKGVIPLLENFDFKARFLTTSFRLIYLQPRKDPKVSRANGPSFNAEMLGWVRSCNPGDRFVVDEIKVKGPDGTVRGLPSATYGVR